MTSAQDLSEYENDPRLFLFTSLTAGSSHIITATSRLETILKANKIPFQAIDIATDETARRLWQRRASKKKLPGLVKDGFVIGDLEEIEEWNEFGELKENIGPVPANNNAPASGPKGVNIRPPEATSSRQVSGSLGAGVLAGNKAPKPMLDESKFRPLPGTAEIAAKYKPQEQSSSIDEPPKPETMNSAPADKAGSINAAKAILKDDRPGLDHLSAPPSAMQSGTATPQSEPVTATAEAGTSQDFEPAVAADQSESQEAPSKALHDRGSELKDAPPEEIKKVESQNALPEEDEAEASDPTKAVEDLKVTDEEKPQSQDPKEGEDATKSVQD